MDGIYSVGEVVRYLRDIIDEDVVLAGIWVSGEVSNLSHSSAGHTYFTLKDQDCQLRCVLFRHVSRGKGSHLKDGMHVLSHGRLGIYETQGSIQLYVDTVQAEGEGLLHRRFEELCARLREEGLFAEERKRALPALPKRIGVVTSAQAAAFADLCRVLARRFPAVEVILSPVLVQGDDAPPQIVAAIEHLGRLGDIDLIIVTRGGGSIEDLWAFNEEAVARAIAASPVPVVTGVGHETDTTIADLVADVRAPTPSAAAMAVVPDREELLAQLARVRAELERLLQERLAQRRKELAFFGKELQAATPLRTLAQRRQQLDDLQAVLGERILHRIAIKGERLRGSQIHLSLLDPLQTLERGFILVTNERGELVRSALEMSTGQTIRLQLRDGSVQATVTAEPVVQPAGRP